MSIALTKKCVTSCCRNQCMVLTNAGRQHQQLNSTISARAFASASGGGGGLFQRVGSFISGAGLTAILTQLYIYDELRQGNRIMISKQKELEARLSKLEK